MKKGPLLYEGKAKRIYSVVGDPGVLWQEFKDFMTAFNGERKEEMPGKGEVNLSVMELLYKHIQDQGLKTHFVQRLSPTECLTKKLEMIPLEVVVRNVWAGSTAKKFRRSDGEAFKRPLFEFYLKDDDLGDPFLSSEQAIALEILDSDDEVREIKASALAINEILKDVFEGAGIVLVDFKVEFGRSEDGALILGDEISPDSCRLWDKVTGRILDKDRFRKGLGEVMSSYHEVLSRLNKSLEV